MTRMIEEMKYGLLWKGANKLSHCGSHTNIFESEKEAENALKDVKIVSSSNINALKVVPVIIKYVVES